MQVIYQDLLILHVASLYWISKIWISEKLGNLTKFVLTISSSLNLSTKMRKSIFYHAGCPVCVSAEHDIISLIGADHVEVVNIGQDKSRISEAENAGVRSVPALLTPNGNVLHINFGAAIEDVKG